MKMHGLVWKQLEMPKEMDKASQDKDTDVGDTELMHSNVNTDIHDHYLEPCSTLLTNITPHTGSCLSPNSDSHNPDTTSCSYGIQALIDNIHQSYDNFDEKEEEDSDQSTEESAQAKESPILRSPATYPVLQLISSILQ